MPEARTQNAPERNVETGNALAADATPWIRLGMRTVYSLIAGLIIFGGIVSINGAVVATGTVTVENNYKTIQHPDGGVVAQIHVRNGELVKVGQELVTLDKTEDRANLSIIESRILSRQIQLARLKAERDREPRFELPVDIKPVASEPRLAPTISSQRALFEARLQSRTGEQKVLTQRVEQLTAQLTGLQAQLDSRKAERDLTQTDLAAVKKLFKKGFANRQRLTALARDNARLEGEVGRLLGDVVRIQGALTEAQLQKVQSEKTFTESVVDELQKIEADLSELEENQTKLRQKLKRTIVRSPYSGRVHALQIHTEGGVIKPANSIMQIIPDGERLVIEARVPPQQIDRVRQGSSAGIRFPAFNARSTPRLEGKVVTVSPAQINDQQGETYFTALIEIPSAEIGKIPTEHRLIPGMPAEVYIVTGARSILSYFLKPLVDAMFPAFREI
ncbi:MAG: HlyD family type I secretion periplasmic adaptor subunit [Pseudomonadota bacterium]